MDLVTISILAILFLVYFTANNKNTGNEVLNYHLRTAYHADLRHLAANSISFFALSNLERAIGWDKYLGAVIFIWVVSSMLLYVYHVMFPSRKIYTIGFSSVVFGLTVVYAATLKNNPGMSIAGLVATIVPQIFVPGISFEGHAAGIIAGIIFISLFSPSKLLIK